jgi:hypothetical protein
MRALWRVARMLPLVGTAAYVGVRVRMQEFQEEDNSERYEVKSALGAIVTQPESEKTESKTKNETE